VEGNGSTAPLRDEMILRLVGHACVLIQSPDGVRVLIDPFGDPPEGPRWFERPISQILTDVLVVTHDHFDHAAEGRVTPVHAVIREPGTVVVGDVRVETWGDVHVPQGDVTDFPNMIAMVETGGIRFCHLGDNRPDVAREIVDACRPVHVLAVPVDDACCLMTFDAVQRLIEAFSPSVVVPVHYRQPGITAEASPLGTIEQWLGTQPGVRHIDGEVAIGTLPPEREVWVLDPVRGP
jgi:L-ascorbate metabolism protein UlaG (beta-lactamase superfamily)